MNALDPLLGSDLRGESLTVTMDGRPIADLRPLPLPRRSAALAPSRWLPIYTCNPGDFAGIDGVEIVAVAVPTLPVRT